MDRPAERCRAGRAGHLGEPTLTGRRRSFGTSWWGRAWVDALEGRARLDPNRLPRGRTYARQGTVGELRLAAGAITADVQGSRDWPYQVRVRVRVFDNNEWDRVLDSLAAEIGHLAALLDGELPPRVAADVRTAGLDLLPGPGELQPRCSCPDWADPCKHAAAVCYLVADALDEDPFGLLALRGRDRKEVLAGLRARRRPAMATATAPDE
ncbi:MAG: SWIM zinc finger family protein, partial [Actinomycetota bacterium]|nr:SWIM zinc finger family protein [Actinomycetota bacterium]